MSGYSYSTGIGENEVAAVGVAMPISTKTAIEVCSALRGKKIERAKAILADAVSKKSAIPFRRFTDGVGHRRGMVASGRFPEKACNAILKIINSAQANAQYKGLGSSLVVRHICAQRCASTPRYGRRRMVAKRTTIEVVLQEQADAKKEKPVKKEAKAAQ